MKTLSLALRNLTRNKRRNSILAFAISFGFFVVTAIDGLTMGMVNNFENQIAQLLGGNVLTQGIEWKKPETPNGKPTLVNIVRDRDYMKNIVEELNIKYDYYSCYTISGGTLIFNGKKSAIELYGRDLEEKQLLDTFQFASGGVDLSVRNGIIISDKIADSMNLQVGDELIYSTSTVYGQNTFADLVVTGIIKSNSFLNSMQSYADIEDVNKIVEMPEGGYSIFSLYLRNKNKQTKVANMIEERIRKDAEKDPQINVTSRALAKKTNKNDIGKGIEKQIDVKNPENEWDGVMYAVETLYDEMPWIKTVLNYVHVITTVILAVILLIVMVGVSNTYRMVLYERIREIGTMRAIGMNGISTRLVFTNEAIILCIIGAIGGLIMSIIAMSIVHYFYIDWEALSFFLNKGHFTFRISVGAILAQYLLLILLTIIAVWGSASKAARMNPAEALRSIK